MRTLLCFLLFIPLLGFSQEYTDQWEDFSSYYQIQEVTTGSGKVYAAAKNGVFSYETSTGGIQKISSVQGLSGENIASLYYSAAYKLLLIGYENGLIEVYNADTKKVLTVIDIQEKQTVTPDNKRINDFYEYEGVVYISTNYGISVYDLTNLEFGDTFFIGDNGSQLAIGQTTVFNGQIYAASEDGGIRTTNVDNPNLVDYHEWQMIANGSWQRVFNFGEKLYGLQNENTIYRINNTATSLALQFSGPVQDVTKQSDFLTVTQLNKIRIFDGQLQNIFNTNNPADFTPGYQCATLDGNKIYIGDRKSGLLKTAFNTNGIYESISPQGPLLNTVFNLDAIPNELWATFGDYDQYLNPFPLRSRGLSHLKNDDWINIPFEELLGARNLVKATINPQKPKQVFVSSFVDGLLEINDDQVEKLYDPTNSNLTYDEDPDLNTPDVRVNGSAFDNQGNLWVVNSKTTEGLVKVPEGGGSFDTFDLTDAISGPGSTLGLTELVIDNANNIYFGSGNDGLIGYQPSTNTFAKVFGGENQGNLPNDYVLSLAIDNNNQLWIGTLRGLRVLYGPSAMFTNPETSANQIIIADSDGVAQELLFGTTIAAITVDGNNNKWIATDAGAFLLSSNGQETLANFTTKNSPLPSNTVTDIAIDDSSGLVYFATSNGIVAYRGKVTGAQETLKNVRAFPNPVRPRYSGMVTIDGLMENANVKITDIAGNLVYEKVSDGGSIQWDTRAFGRHKVASGVYLVLITSDDQLETKVAKIMIIR